MTKKLTAAIALEMVKRIEALQDQISAVYREAGDYDGTNNANVIRDIVKARDEQRDAEFIATGMLESLDIEDEAA